MSAKGESVPFYRDDYSPVSLAFSILGQILHLAPHARPDLRVPAQASHDNFGAPDRAFHDMSVEDNVAVGERSAGVGAEQGRRGGAERRRGVGELRGGEEGGGHARLGGEGELSWGWSEERKDFAVFEDRLLPLSNPRPISTAPRLLGLEG